MTNSLKEPQRLNVDELFGGAEAPDLAANLEVGETVSDSNDVGQALIEVNETATWPLAVPSQADVMRLLRGQSHLLKWATDLESFRSTLTEEEKAALDSKIPAESPLRAVAECIALRFRLELALTHKPVPPHPHDTAAIDALAAEADKVLALLGEKIETSNDIKKLRSEGRDILNDTTFDFLDAAQAAAGLPALDGKPIGPLVRSRSARRTRMVSSAPQFQAKKKRMGLVTGLVVSCVVAMVFHGYQYLTHRHQDWDVQTSLASNPIPQELVMWARTVQPKEGLFMFHIMRAPTATEIQQIVELAKRYNSPVYRANDRVFLIDKKRQPPASFKIDEVLSAHVPDALPSDVPAPVEGSSPGQGAAPPVAPANNQRVAIPAPPVQIAPPSNEAPQARPQ